MLVSAAYQDNHCKTTEITLDKNAVGIKVVNILVTSIQFTVQTHGWIAEALAHVAYYVQRLVATTWINGI